jgi:hypothetical protein
VVPVGLALVATATARSRLLNRAGRLAAAALTPVLILSALASAATASPWLSAAAVTLFALCWTVLGHSLLRA